MSRDITDSVLSALSDDVIYPFYATELMFDSETLRLWTGEGTLVFDGKTWVGVSTLLGIDAVEETSEIVARGATMTLSGVPSEVLSLALSEPYQGRICTIYFGTFTKGYVLAEDTAYILQEDGSKIELEDAKTDLTQIFSGYMDQMNISEGADSSSITLLVENRLIDLERPRTSRYTSAYQKSLFPDDKGLDFIESLQDQEIFWGRASPNTNGSGVGSGGGSLLGKF